MWERGGSVLAVRATAHLWAARPETAGALSTALESRLERGRV